MLYPYLNDKEFLKDFDLEKYKVQYIKITVLDFSTEETIATIEGVSTGGTCNLSGSSNMRRSGSCSLVVDPNGIQRANGQFINYADITEVENLISMNKKVQIETGFENTLTDQYTQYAGYDILWFPLGVYVIKNASVNCNASTINISLTLNDKCAILNGDLGGAIPADTIFSEVDTYSFEMDSTSTEKILIKDLIRSIVVEYGGQPADKIIITDIPDTITKVMKWNGKSTLYFYQEGDESGSKQYSLIDPRLRNDFGYINLIEYSTGALIGYINADFVYPGTLECKAGETVAAVLDKIKNTLGNFEWFFDLQGNFVFQEIKNYLNNSYSTSILS